MAKVLFSPATYHSILDSLCCLVGRKNHPYRRESEEKNLLLVQSYYSPPAHLLFHSFKQHSFCRLAYFLKLQRLALEPMKTLVFHLLGDYLDLCTLHLHFHLQHHQIISFHHLALLIDLLH